MLKILLLAIISCQAANSRASNELRELEYAEEIKASFSTGKITWLKTKTKSFLALYTETEGKENLGTAIILHSANGHPNQKKLIHPLRTYLPEHNWATLSLQMPVLGVGAKEDEYYTLFDDANVRIQAAIDYLISAKVKNITLIGYGLGGMMAVYYIKKNVTKTDVDALVAISLAVPKTDRKQVQIIDFISSIKQPFLDIFAEFDLAAVTKTARQRRIAGKTNSSYRQFEIKGEGHLFQHDEGLVVKRVYSWINRTFR
jgi:predicted alpha/beta-fold hydrolase